MTLQKHFYQLLPNFEVKENLAPVLVELCVPKPTVEDIEVLDIFQRLSAFIVCSRLLQFVLGLLSGLI